jgi:hypothetical protein
MDFTILILLSQPQKSFLQSGTSTAKSKEEYFEVMKQHFDSGKGDFMFSSSSASSSSGSYTPLSNKNKDDYYTSYHLYKPIKKSIFKNF